MKPDRWEHVRTLFEAALERAPSERAAFLRAACAGDPGLHAEVASLLQSHATDGQVDRMMEAMTGGSHRRPGADDVEGRRVGPYALIEELGRGGMGRVFRARRADGQFEQKVALKLTAVGFPSEEARTRFLVERQILASLNHPHIARLLDGGMTADGQLYFALEMVPGDPIDTYCKTNGVPIQTRVQLVLDVCEAVQHAHRQLIVHRDLKPSNILVSEDDAREIGRVKLLDFGIAKLLDPAVVGDGPVPQTRTGRLPMTPGYASPEQVRGDSITTASDVYQLGLVLYELLTGQRPYSVKGRTPSEIERIVCEEQPPRPSAAVTAASVTAEGQGIHAVRRALQGDLDTIVLKALRKEPERRYASVQQLADDLRRYLQGQPVSAHPDSWAYRGRKFVRRHRWGVAVTALVGALLTASVVALSVQNARLAAERDRAELEAAKKAHVQDFMIELFSHTDASTTPQQVAAISGVLNRGAARVERDLADHPAIRADMLQAVGAVHKQLEQYAAAGPLLEKALHAFEAAYGPAHPSVAAAARDLAEVAQAKGDLDRSEALHRQALSIYEDAAADHPIRTAAARHDLAVVLHEKGQPISAQSFFDKALPVYRNTLGRSHASAAEVFAAAAAVEQTLRNYARADHLLEEALDILAHAARPGHPDRPRYLIDRAELLRAQGAYAEAEPLLIEAHTLVETHHADTNPELREDVLEALVAVYCDLERPEAAAAYRTFLAER